MNRAAPKNVNGLKSRLWPRLMRIDVLTEYCGVSKNTVKRDVQLGRLPEPVIKERGRVQWDKAEVDRFIDRLSQGSGLRGWDDIG